MGKYRIWWSFIILNVSCVFTYLILCGKRANTDVLNNFILSFENVDLRIADINVTRNFTIIDDTRDVHSYDICGNYTLASLSGLSMTSSGWQEVRGQQDMLVYSAFWDARLAEPSVMILGLKSETYNQSLWCLLWYEEEQSAVTTSARYQHVKVNKRGR